MRTMLAERRTGAGSMCQRSERRDSSSKRIDARLPRTSRCVAASFPFQQRQIYGQHLERVYDREQCRERADKQREFASDHSDASVCFPRTSIKCLARLSRVCDRQSTRTMRRPQSARPTRAARSAPLPRPRDRRYEKPHDKAKHANLPAECDAGDKCSERQQEKNGEAGRVRVQHVLHARQQHQIYGAKKASQCSAWLPMRRTFSFHPERRASHPRYRPPRSQAQEIPNKRWSAVS